MAAAIRNITTPSALVRRMTRARQKHQGLAFNAGPFRSATGAGSKRASTSRRQSAAPTPLWRRFQRSTRCPKCEQLLCPFRHSRVRLASRRCTHLIATRAQYGIGTTQPHAQIRILLAPGVIAHGCLSSSTLEKVTVHSISNRRHRRKTSNVRRTPRPIAMIGDS